MASPESGVQTSGTTKITTLHPDILSHILRHFDGATLATFSCTNPQLRSLSKQDFLWQSLCHVAFPAISTNPPLHHIISSFPGGFRSFYADSFPLISGILPPPHTVAAPLCCRPSDLISLVEIYHDRNPLFSKILYGIPETDHDWLCSFPFRIDLLDQQDYPPAIFSGEKAGHQSLAKDLRLSWVAVDKKVGRAVNLSSWTPVSVQKNWFSDIDFSVKFASILQVPDEGFVQFGIVVRCDGCGEGEIRVREVSLQVADLDGRNLNGKKSLEILQRAMECERGRKESEEVVQKRHDEFVKLQVERKQKKMKIERRVDMACVVSGILFFFCFLGFSCFHVIG